MVNGRETVWFGWFALECKTQVYVVVASSLDWEMAKYNVYKE
jgi:hypothetical protein